MKTCTKQTIRFWDYLGGRLNVPDAAPIPPLQQLVRKTAAA